MAYYNMPNPEVEGFETMKRINRMLIDSGSISSRSAYRRAILAIREEDFAALKEMHISREVLTAECRSDLLENMIRISDVCYNQMLGQRISPYQNNVYNKETTVLLPEWNQQGRRLAANAGEPVCEAGRMFYRQLGIYQHDLYSWEVLGTDFIRMKSITDGSRFIDRTLKEWLQRMDSVQRETFIDTLFSVLDAAGVSTFSELKEDLLKNSGAIVKAAMRVDPKTRKVILEILSQLVNSAQDTLPDFLPGRKQ